MDQELADRLATVERAVTDGETDLENVVDGAATADRIADLEGRVEDLEDEVGELDAAVQAVRGYVGEIRAINEEVEETAAAAMAKADRAVGTEGERPADTEVARTDGHDGVSPLGTEAEGDAGRQPAAGETSDRISSTVRSRNAADHSTHPASAATAAARVRDATARQDPRAGSCAGEGGTTRSGACPACGRAAENEAGAGPGSVQESGRSGGDRGLLARVRDLL